MNRTSTTIQAALRPSLRLSLLGLGATLFAIPLAWAERGLAQEATTTQTADEVIFGQETSNPFSSSGNGAGSFLELIQQLNKGSTLSPSEFQANQQKNLDNAALDFQRRQLELIRGQQEETVEAPVIEKGAEGPEGELQSANPQPVYPALW